MVITKEGFISNVKAPQRNKFQRNNQKKSVTYALRLTSISKFGNYFQV